jgi:hypothetical protein
MKRKLPDFSILEPSFLDDRFTADEVKRLVGGAVNDPKLKNTCIIRVSRSLNSAGHLIPVWTKPFRTRMGSDKRWYGLRVKEFWDYMLKTYGPPDVYAKAPIDRAAFASAPGIIGFRRPFKDATGHFTLWDGSDLLQGGLEHDYFAEASEAALWKAGSTRVLVAPV